MRPCIHEESTNSPSLSLSLSLSRVPRCTCALFTSIYISTESADVRKAVIRVLHDSLSPPASARRGRECEILSLSFSAVLISLALLSRAERIEAFRGLENSRAQTLYLVTEFEMWITWGLARCARYVQGNSKNFFGWSGEGNGKTE